MTHIVMLLSNPFRPDPRVLKEARGLVQRGYRVTILCWDRLCEYSEAEELESQLEVLRIRRIQSGYGIGLGQISKLVRFWRVILTHLHHLDPDMVHCHDFDTLPVGVYWCKRNNVPLVYDAHEYYADLVKPRLRGVIGKWIYDFITFSERWCAQRADAIITVDESLAKIYRSLNNKVHVIGHFPPSILCENPAEVFSGPVLTLLYIGRISQDRGSILYVDILRALLKDRIPARLVIAGVFTPTQEEGLFWERASGIEGNINFINWVHYDNILGVMRTGDVGLSILQPSPRYIAAVPVKLLEYMAVGLPVLASKFPAVQAIVEPANCGCLIDPTNSKEALSVIKDWWQHPEIPRELGKNGTMAIRNKYNWDDLMDKLDQLYQTLM